MKLKFLVSMAGHRHTWNPGEIHEVANAAECKRLIAAGYAVEVRETGSAARAAVAKAKAKAKPVAKPKTETARVAPTRAERRAAARGK